MKIFKFDQDSGINVTHFNSNFIMSRIIKTAKPVQIGCMHLKAKDIIGYHQAVVPQLLLIVEGNGWVRSDHHSKTRVKKGDAVFWEAGEGHETTTDSGLTAIAIESDELTPENFMLEKSV